jgi:hypothetical protein
LGLDSIKDKKIREMKCFVFLEMPDSVVVIPTNAERRNLTVFTSERMSDRFLSVKGGSK